MRIHQMESNGILSDVLDTQTDDPLDWIRGQSIEVIPKYSFWSWQDLRASKRKKRYYLTTISKSIPNFTFLKAEWFSEDGRNQQWKFNFIGVDDKIIKSYWLNTLDQCSVQSNWYLQDVKAFSVNARNIEDQY